MGFFSGGVAAYITVEVKATKNENTIVLKLSSLFFPFVLL
jgi:hypothetical protein